MNEKNPKSQKKRESRLRKAFYIAKRILKGGRTGSAEEKLDELGYSDVSNKAVVAAEAAKKLEDLEITEGGDGSEADRVNPEDLLEL